MNNIIVGISGSIAAYKSIELVKQLDVRSYNATIVLSKSAPDFISTLTLRSLFPNQVYLSGDLLSTNDAMLHIDLAKMADIIVIAPCSANMIASLTSGQASCLLTTICLASQARIALVPAMNKIMWENSIVQSNIQKLKEHGFLIWGPASGEQACGDVGYGRMIEPSQIINEIESLELNNSLLTGKRVIVTAGPTIEPLDPTRFISNYSSGKMGYAIAESARNFGAEVTLISGPTALAAPFNINIIQVKTADEMLQAARSACANADIFISNAAVADYRPSLYSAQKIKKSSLSDISINLVKNQDIISTIKQEFPNIFSIGFAAETEEQENNG
jgi:phosphopantothenoylcysteine decarboxylase/phosphopantothenate--cysteine ligase